MLVMTMVYTNLLSSVFLLSLSVTTQLLVELDLEDDWSRHCFGGSMFGLELQSQMKSEMATSLLM